MEVKDEVSTRACTKLVLSYGTFKVDGPSTSYTLQVSDKQHEGHDFFGSHNAMNFSTFNQDIDKRPVGSCSYHTTRWKLVW